MHPELYLDLYHQERADLDRRLHERARRAVRSVLGPQPAPVAGVVCCTA
ncbi:hypothetical protein [Cellulomonas biazotea]|uniref:Uncharacterized protein n=1 Tax=Cellulomonas biazotea TaxID=1709 RepID=A0A402DSI9_9CELL|nr:hypothetical protein [Cellulomonas biazotea]GCE77036.1 hypothetical protein CBZ_20920 [Cellulomonas biazotea]